MSVKVSGFIWDYYEWGGGEKLTMLALADEADHDGNGIYPSVARVAVRCNMSERQVQRNIKAITERVFLGVPWLIQVGRNTGGRKVTNRYRVPMADLQAALRETTTDCHPLKGRQDDGVNDGKGDICDGKGDTDVTRPVLPVITHSQEKNYPQPRDGVSRSRFAHPVPRDFKPTPAIVQRCKQHGCPAITADHIAAFISVFESTGTTLVDWQPRFFKWMLDEKGKEKQNENRNRARAVNVMTMDEPDLLKLGRELGVNPEVGESMYDFRARVRSAQSAKGGAV